MKKKTTKKEEVVEVVEIVEAVEVPKEPTIKPIVEVLGNGDLNILKDKINEIIAIING